MESVVLLGGLGKLPEHCRADAFLLFYMKRRIERPPAWAKEEKSLEWFGAPCCWGDEGQQQQPLEEQWLLLERTCRMFEQDNREQLETKMVVQLLQTGKCNFIAFKKIVKHYLDILDQRGLPSISLLALISFTGYYARRLAEESWKQAERAIAHQREERAEGEEDDSEEEGEGMPQKEGQREQDDQLPPFRDYRREIYQISIYGSQMLKERLNCSWDQFCADVANLMEQIKLEDERKAVQQQQQNKLCPSSSLLFHLALVDGCNNLLSSAAASRPANLLMALPLAFCGIGAAAAAYFLVRRSFH